MQNTGTVIAIILVVVLFVVLLGGVGMMGFGGFGMGGMMGNFGGMMGNVGGFGFNPVGAILSLVLWALIIAGVVLLVVWLVRSLAGASPTSPTVTGQSPLDILKTRYAKGEITKEQFEEMKRDLGG
jgi:putative membrane protein